VTDANVAFLMIGILMGSVGTIAVLDFFTLEHDEDAE
jgi:hypothetical protein